MKRDERNTVDIIKIQLAFRSFHKHSLIMTISSVSLALLMFGGILDPQGYSYADTGSGTGNISSPADVEKSDNQVFSIMKQQLRSYQQSLEESEGRLQDFQRKHGIILIETQMNHLLQQRKSLDDSLKDAENRVKGFQEKLAWVQSQISQIP
ncbi:MAG: hypothetical protein KIT39_19675, partial [Nitrospirales bacterium]|nr:hypothetical protein [Nitrospirales bacterium]